MPEGPLPVFSVPDASGANDRERIQDAIDEASTAGGGTVYFPAQTYVVNVLMSTHTIELASNVIMDFAGGAILDCSGSNANRVLFRATGSEAGAVALTANVSPGATVVNIDAGSAGQFARGDVVRIAASTPYETHDNQGIGELGFVEVPRLTAAVGPTDTALPLDNTQSLPSSGTIRVGSEEMTYTKPSGVKSVVELTVVRGVNGTTAASHSAGADLGLLPLGSVLLQMPLQGGPYLTSADAGVSKLTMKQGITWRGGTIVGSGAGDNQVGLRFDRAMGVRVEDARFESVDGMAVSIADSIDVSIEGIAVNATHRQEAAGPASGYGVGLSWCAQDCTVRRSFFRRCRHATSVGADAARRGIPRRVTFEGNRIIDSTGSAMDLHEPCDSSISFLGNQIADCLGAFNIYNNGATIVGNVVSGCANGLNFANRTVAAPTRLVFSDNVIQGCDTAVDIGMSASDDDSPAIEFITVNGNSIVGARDTAIDVFSVHASRIVVAVCIAANSIRAGSAGGIRLSGVDGASVSSNVLTDIADTATGIELATTSNAVVSANVVQGADTGVEIASSSSACVVMANHLRGCTTPLSVAGSDHIVSTADASGAYNRT